MENVRRGKEIIGYFLDERGETIGVIAVENIAEYL
jgi:Mg2+/Co2+ transporter CorB